MPKTRLRGHAEHSKNLLRAAGLVCLILLFTFQVQAADWITTSFEAYEGKPVETADWAEREEGRASRKLNPAILRDTENYLFAVAKRLENMGFADPVAAGVLNSLVTREDGTKVIRVYLYSDPASGSLLAFYRPPPPCSSPGTRSFIQVNTATFGFLAKIHDRDYNTLAHELFHSVQFASKFMKNEPCKRSKWIREGTADAVGIHFARVLRNAQNRPTVSPGMFVKEFGIRAYNYPLNKPNTANDAHKTDHYQTSSFWRHLAEIYNMKVKHQKPHPGSRPLGEDYTYLADFFNQPYSYGANRDGEIAWLNEKMRSNTKIRSGLNEVYPQFVSTFADIINTRIGPVNFLEAGDRQTRWLSRIFGACKDVKIPPAPAAMASETTSLRPNSANCMTVTKSGVSNSALTIIVTHNDKDLLKQLRISTLDGSMGSRPKLDSQLGGGPPHVAKWIYPMFGPYSKSFVLSNVAEHPAATRAFDPELKMSIGNWNSNMTHVPPQATPPPQGPQQPPVGPSQPPLAPPTTNRVTQFEKKKQQVQAAITDPVNNLKPVLKVTRRNYHKPVNCNSLRLKHNLCGPRLVLNLELSPIVLDGNILDFSQGLALQMGIGLDPENPQAFRGYERQMANALELERHFESTDGNKIVLKLPKIEYGFTGQIDNVEITVSKAGGGSYISYGPEVDYGNQIIHRPRNGHVTVEEYSPTVFTGSFSASLVDPDNAGRDEAPIIARQVSGSFLAPAPYERDENYQVGEGSVRDAAFQNMLDQSPFSQEFFQEMAGVDGSPPQILCNNGISDAQLRSMGFKKGCGDIAKQIQAACTCECLVRENEEKIPECERHCRREWRNCPVDMSQVPTGLEEQIEYCSRKMKEKGVPEGQIPLFMNEIRKVPESMRPGLIGSLCG